MALPIDNDDLNKKQQQGSTVSQPPGQPGVGANQPGQVGSTGSQPGTPARQVGTQGPQPKGTGYTNIQKIIGANQGNKLGQTVVGGIQQTGQQAGQAIQQAGQQFQQNLGQSQQQLQQGNQGFQNSLTQALNIDPTKQLSDDDYSKAQQFLQGQYSGPTELANAGQVAAQAADAEQLGKLGGSEAGRTGLLQRFVGAPQYSQGQQKLDNLLLGSNSGAINQARAATQGLSGKAAGSVEAARAQAQVAAAQDAATRQSAKAAGQQDVTNVNTDLKSDAQKYLQNALNVYSPDAAKAALSSANFGLLNTNLTPQQKAALLAKNPNLAQVSGASMSQADLQKMQKSGDYSALLGKTSDTAEKKAQSFNALNKLLGSGDQLKTGDKLNVGAAGLNKNALDQLNTTLGDQAKTTTDKGYQNAVNQKADQYHTQIMQQNAQARANQFATADDPFAGAGGPGSAAHGNPADKPAYDSAKANLTSQLMGGKMSLAQYNDQVGSLNKSYNQKGLVTSFMQPDSVVAKEAGGLTDTYKNKLLNTSQNEGLDYYNQQLKSAQQAALKQYLG